MWLAIWPFVYLDFLISTYLLVVFSTYIHGCARIEPVIIADPNKALSADLSPQYVKPVKVYIYK